MPSLIINRNRGRKIFLIIMIWPRCSISELHHFRSGSIFHSLFFLSFHSYISSSNCSFQYLTIFSFGKIKHFYWKKKILELTKFKVINQNCPDSLSPESGSHRMIDGKHSPRKSGRHCCPPARPGHWSTRRTLWASRWLVLWWSWCHLHSLLMSSYLVSIQIRLMVKIEVVVGKKVNCRFHHSKIGAPLHHLQMHWFVHWIGDSLQSWRNPLDWH